MPDPVSRPQPPHAGSVDPRELARYFRSTRRLASVLVGAESLGEDASQDVILAALQRPLRVERGFGAWFVGAVHVLPEPYRTPIILRYLEEHDTREVADELDRPISTVQTQLQRGLGLLRERLSAEDRRCEGDWREALALLCVPHSGSIRARIEEQERLHRPSPTRWHAPDLSRAGRGARHGAAASRVHGRARQQARLPL